MLKTRVITAVLLLAVLLPILFFKHVGAFNVVVSLFMAAAAWEGMRLFRATPRVFAIGMAALFTAGFAYVNFAAADRQLMVWCGICTFLWAMRFTPALAIGQPPRDSLGNLSMAVLYGVAIFGCFSAIVALFARSPLYLLSVMVLVWIADIGAYFSGKAFGKRKLAPTISPGKSWEGVYGGAVAVLAIASVSIVFGGAALADTFAVRLQAVFGWVGALCVLLLVVAASVIGDLFESQLKRSAGMKDSSNLLPGHGGVLDRVDALIPVLPLAALINFWL